MKYFFKLMAHDKLKPCELCRFPVEESTLWVNFKYAQALVCGKCLHKINLQKRKEKIQKDWVNKAHINSTQSSLID